MSGKFPPWIESEQFRVLTLNDDTTLIEYAKTIVDELLPYMARVACDFSANPVQAKIADAETARVHTMLVIGGRDVEAGNVSVRLHSKGPHGAKPETEVIADILGAIRERKGN